MYKLQLIESELKFRIRNEMVFLECRSKLNLNSVLQFL